ncbi:hypothetical protein CY35_09G063500 [Sphagnum magellanicum]|nr:hypothetical protein CY35_09G063500 [Sphagnum magellanicum]
MTINSNSADQPSILHNLCSQRYHGTIEKATDLYVSKLTVTTIIFISFCNCLSFSKGKEVGEEREKVILQQSSSKQFGSISILHLVPVALFFGSSTTCLDKEI